MNEELQKALGELLNKASGGIDAAGGFLASELPEVIQQILMWHGVYNFILFCIGFVFIGLSIYAANKCIEKLKSAKIDYVNGEVWTRYNGSGSTTSHAYDNLFFINIIPLVLFVIGVCALNIEWLQIWIAPKVWLIEYAAKLAE